MQRLCLFQLSLITASLFLSCASLRIFVCLFINPGLGTISDTFNPESIITSTTGKRENIKSWDNRLESANHSHCVSNVYEKMFIKEQSSKNGAQFFESVRYKGNIRRYLKEAPAIVTKMICIHK